MIIGLSQIPRRVLDGELFRNPEIAIRPDIQSSRPGGEGGTPQEDGGNRGGLSVSHQCWGEDSSRGNNRSIRTGVTLAKHVGPDKIETRQPVRSKP